MLWAAQELSSTCSTPSDLPSSLSARAAASAACLRASTRSAALCFSRLAWASGVSATLRMDTYLWPLGKLSTYCSSSAALEAAVAQISFRACSPGGLPACVQARPYRPGCWQHPRSARAA